MNRISLPAISGEGGRSRLHHCATTLLRHYPQGAVSTAGLDAAREYLQSGAGSAAFLLETLPPAVFRPYVPELLARNLWSQPVWSGVLQSVSVFESMLGCLHACEMCYI